jgi:hypothetical protein
VFHIELPCFIPLKNAMPGEYCSLYGCSNSRKNPKVSFFKIPTVKNTDSDYTKEKKLRARLAWIKCLTRTRVLDADLQRQIDENTIHICEIHFKEEDLIKRKWLFC